VIDTDGTKVLSRRVPNNEPELLELIADVLDISQDVTWAIDLNAGGAALLITPSSPSPGAASTFCGPSCGTTGPSNSTRPETIPQRTDTA
jgi:hypothetical protein